MKIIDSVESENKGFTPFKATFEFETGSEARLMFHVLNRIGLRTVIFTERYGSTYNNNVDEEFRGDIQKQFKDLLYKHGGSV